MKEKIKRNCIFCGKLIPNFRSEQAKTCSIKCSNAWNWLSGNERKKRREENQK